MVTTVEPDVPADPPPPPISENPVVTDPAPCPPGDWSEDEKGWLRLLKATPGYPLKLADDTALLRDLLIEHPPDAITAGLRDYRYSDDRKPRNHRNQVRRFVKVAAARLKETPTTFGTNGHVEQRANARAYSNVFE